MLILPLTPAEATRLTDAFMKGTVRKEYIARVKGEFPAYVDESSVLDAFSHSGCFREAMLCKEPLLTVDRQMGLNIVHPEGKVGFFLGSLNL